MTEPAIEIQIGAYRSATRDVQATFTSGEIEHIRSVNAVHDADGQYDPVATALQVEQVGRGVLVKIVAGAIQAPTPPEDE